MQNYRELVNQVVGKKKKKREHVDKPKEICFCFIFFWQCWFTKLWLKNNITFMRWPERLYYSAHVILVLLDT